MSRPRHPGAGGQLAQALAQVTSTLVRHPSRSAPGPHEELEFAPVLKTAMIEVWAEAGLKRRVELNSWLPIASWTRPKSEVDLVVFSDGEQVELVAELKVWEIGHQLFDLAKVCALLEAGAAQAFLICIAERPRDFDRYPGGELFPAHVGEKREHRFGELISRHEHEWSYHVGNDGPEPASVPTEVQTATVAAGTDLDTYPSHEIRAVEVTILDPTPITLRLGMPDER